MEDLFENITETEPQVQNIVSQFNNLFEKAEIDSYALCKAFLDALEPFGYIFDYGLDAEPHNLRKLHQLEHDEVWAMSLDEVHQCMAAAEHDVVYSEKTWELLNLRMRSL